MAWDHLSVTKPHLVYLILGGFTSLFMLCSSIVKERMYIGEATVATLCGVIFGPHAANLIDPGSWGNVDLVTLEFSRIVLVVQCFAVGVELPKFYMERHWKSVTFLLIPVMTFGWLVVSLVIWWMVPPLNWLESLVVAACVTATDPVLASSVVGKGKFAKRIPKHLRDVLSAESGCNDGMAFPFVYLGIYLIQEHMDARDTVYHWMVVTILYECFFGAIYGFTIGYIARHAIKYAEDHDLIDRQSFLVFYFVLALFCAGSGSLLGMDDLLIGFAAGVGFSNDGWFHAKTEESHVSNVIDLLINLTYFVYLGTIIPWEQYNNVAGGLTAWRLVVLAIFVILFRRIPAMLLLKPFIPDIKTWREAMFAGHFGPIGVGAIFVAILARAELAYETAVPLSDTPPPHVAHSTLIAVIWPIVSFLVITSIIVHGSSVAVFTLGKRINTLNLTMSYTTSPDDGPSWMNRLPRISSQSRSQARSITETSQNENTKFPDLPPGTLPPVGVPGQFLRRQKEVDDDSDSKYGMQFRSNLQRRRKSRERFIGEGGPIAQSAIFPARRASTDSLPTTEKDRSGDVSGAASGSSRTAAADNGYSNDGYDKEMERQTSTREAAPELQIYDEGGNLIVETRDGDVLALEETPNKEAHKKSDAAGVVMEKTASRKADGGSGWESFKRAVGDAYSQEIGKRKVKSQKDQKHEPARAFQFGNTIVIEDEDGEVIKKYDISDQKKEKEGTGWLHQCQKYLGIGRKDNTVGTEEEAPGPSSGGEASTEPATKVPSRSAWAAGLLGGGGDVAQKQKGKRGIDEGQDDPTGNADDDKKIRFTIDDQGRRMTKDDFIREMRRLGPKARREVVETLEKTSVDDEATESEPEAAEETSVGRGRGGVSSRKTGQGPSVPSDDPDQETPAERRRREAALGVGESSRTGVAARTSSDSVVSGGDEEDSEDEGIPRVPHSKRGIRFANNLDRGRGRGI